MRTPQSRSALEDLRMPVQAKLAAAWTSYMFLSIYIDFIALYKPGLIDNLRAGLVLEFDISHQDHQISTATKAQSRGPASGAFGGRGSAHSAWSALVAI